MDPNQQPPQFNSNLPQNNPQPETNPQPPPYTPPPTQVQPPANDYNPRQRVSDELSVMQEGERVICEIKRHPIGIFGIYFAMGVMLIVGALLLFVFLPNIISDTNGQAMRLGYGVFAVLIAISLIYSLIATTVYWGNKWVVTSDSVTQVSRSSLFGRQSAQLALANVEDVTAEQNGILAHMFNYGILKAETAGHRSKFVFLYAPNPNFYAQKILEARENLAAQGRQGA